MQPRLHYFASSELLAHQVAMHIVDLANRCIAHTGRFSIVLAGGTTPQQIYQRLRQAQTDWQHWHIYFGDERILPRNHPERNDHMAATAWLEHVPIPATQIHTVPVADNANRAAAAYAIIVRAAAGFDLVLLGLGEDGHTASLFPGGIANTDDAALTVAVDNAPKWPAQRVSMSPGCLSRGAAVWFLVTGEGKRHALSNWLAGADLPPQAITPVAGVDIFTDLTPPL
jgi:6-phosphogluconolactonase